MQYVMNKKRVYLSDKPGERGGPVAYWMSRDQRVRDNWALVYAQEKARAAHEPLCVVFCLSPSFLDAARRQYAFMLRGLGEVAEALEKLHIPFFLLPGAPGTVLQDFVRKRGIGLLVTDFDPLRIKRKWKEEVLAGTDIPLHEVDAHNIVPCRHASDKQEYGAYTIRPKIHRLLDEFLDEFPEITRHPHKWKGKYAKADWQKAADSLEISGSVPPVDWIRPGESKGRAALGSFIRNGLSSYPSDRNDPNKNGQSGLSPYLHFGHLSAQRTALLVGEADAPGPAKDAFLEELIVRRELADNFCFYNTGYDTAASFPKWARESIALHAKDKREYLYSRDRFEYAETHDPLWNAAQKEMVVRGKMHGYMRMYWAKKILEWTESADQAMEYAVFLNDRYELDGRYPNGYAGIAWSMGGVHDRAWFERPVFGKVRFMNYNGCRRKFDVDAYINRVEELK